MFDEKLYFRDQKEIEKMAEWQDKAIIHLRKIGAKEEVIKKAELTLNNIREGFLKYDYHYENLGGYPDLMMITGLYRYWPLDLLMDQEMYYRNAHNCNDHYNDDFYLDPGMTDIRYKFVRDVFKYEKYYEAYNNEKVQLKRLPCLCDVYMFEIRMMIQKGIEPDFTENEKRLKINHYI